MPALILLALALSPAQAPSLPGPASDAPAIDAAQLAELHRHPVEDYRCPKSDGHAFAGVTRPRAVELLGEPDSRSQPTESGRNWRTVWRYYVTTGKFDGWVPVEHPSAFYELAFGPGDVVHSVTCREYRGSFSGGWSNILVNPPEAEASEPRRDPAPATREIRAILYSMRTNDEMLAALAKYVKLGQKRKRFERATGLQGFCFGTGTTTFCKYFDAGLELVLDASERVRVIRRDHAQVDGVEYSETSITEPGFRDKDHAMWLEN